MRFLENNRIILSYFFALFITLVLKAVGFSLISKEALVLKYTFFLLFSIAVGIHISKRTFISTKDLFIILGLSIITLFLVSDPLLLAILVTLMVLLFSLTIKNFKGRRALKFITLFICSCFLLVSMLVSIIFLVFGYFLSDFALTQEIRTVPSPDGNYSLVVENVDQGALGGNTVVNIRRSYLGMVQWKKRIYIGRWGEQPNLEWVGNYEVSVNGEHRGIFFGSTLDKR